MKAVESLTMVGGYVDEELLFRNEKDNSLFKSKN